MKKYILIQNDGEIETNSFELIGASTKRGETGKIGFFGSGLKYSIAYMMRNGIDFRVFSGEKELVFTTIPETLKDQTFDRICINGKPTSYTVTMGPTWTEDWFVLREIYCNAIDESNCQLIKETENVNAIAGKTRIYVSLTDSLRNVVDDWDKYFATDREPLCTIDKTYTAFIGSNDIGGSNHQKLSILPKTEGVLFRKNVRIHSDKDLAYDYNFEFAEINEDRTAKHSNAMGYIAVNLMALFPDEEYIINVLRTAQEDTPCDEYQNLSYYEVQGNTFSEKWVAFSDNYLLVIKEISGKFSEQINRTTKEVFHIPSHFAKQLKKKIPKVSILGMGKSINDIGFEEVYKTPKMEFLLKEVLRSLKEMGYECPYPISVVQFDDEKVLGQANIKEKLIFIADQTFDRGRRELALTIIEETEHIASGKDDETRAFQTHLISEWLKSMENSNGLFL